MTSFVLYWVRIVRSVVLISLIFLPTLMVQAQAPNPSPYSTSNKVNYVRTWEALSPTPIVDTLTRRATGDVKQTTQYVDGLGRLLQTVIKQNTPNKVDLVTADLYDPYGRQQYNYLPFASNIAKAGDIPNDGDFKFSPFQQDSIFNKGQFPGQTYFYSQNVFESSPLQRPVASYAAGNSWVGQSRGLTSQYLMNSISDSVRIWNISSMQGTMPVDGGIYPASQLDKTISTDEQSHQTVTFRDKEGHIVLKRFKIANTPGNGHVGWQNIYYIYDSLSNLRFVIQPRAVELMNTTSGTWTLTQSISDELCFRYEYDSRNRVVIKKIPGAGEVWIVYDLRDRIVMTQDSIQRAGSPAKWFVTEYDSLNRPFRAGLLTDANNRAYHQNLAYNSISYPSTAANYDIVSQTYFDDYSWVSASGSGLGTDIDSTFFSNSNYFITSYGVSQNNAIRMSRNLQVRGAITGHKQKVIPSTSSYLYTVYFFDDHKRIIQSRNTNYTSGKDTTSIQYDFSGKPLRTYFKHSKAGNVSQYHTVLTKLEYDHAARVRRIWKNTDQTGDQLIDSLQYNELGQLRAKYLGNALDSLIYDYNIRGWATNINKSYLTGAAPHYFGMELNYDTTSSVTGTAYTGTQMNGNIAGTTWKGADGTLRRYNFSYDNLNRLTAAAFGQAHASLYDLSAGIDFSIGNLSYDVNGNILSAVQKGVAGITSKTIDSLTYKYANTNASNRLELVTDGANDSASSLGDFHYKIIGKGTVDYGYDGNGNIASDFNKGISGIVYNHLNLPQTVYFSNNKGSIDFTYDGQGNKLAKLTRDSLSRHATTTLYLNGFIYQHQDTITNPTAGVDTLQFMQHEEGRARWAFHRWTNAATGYKWEYDFFEKDYLGNIRTVLTQQRDTAQYHATMEAAYRNTENLLFYNIPSTNVWSYYVNGATNPFGTGITNPNDSVSRISGSTPKEGPAIILKVMAGDRYIVGVQAYWKSGQTNTGTTDATTEILASLANGIIGASGTSKGSYSVLSNTTTSPLLPAVASFRSGNNPTPPSDPKAYLNYVVLDNQFNYDSASSGAKLVGAADALRQPFSDTMRIKKSGYLYIYLSNESKGVSVFFDNLSVTHYAGPLLEETHYYPFGLTMAGISDKALKSNYTENKYKFSGKELNNKEFNDGSGLEEYDFGIRNYDPQIMRWRTVDPKSDQMRRFSPYNYAYDNPLRFIDPDGMKPSDWVHYHDENDVAHTDWIEEVHDQKSADEWARKQGKDANGNQKNTDVKYIGKEGYVTNAYKEDGQKRTTYKLNSDHTATEVGAGGGGEGKEGGEASPKPSKTEETGEQEPDEEEELNPVETHSTIATLMGGIAEAAVKWGPAAEEDLGAALTKTEGALRGLGTVTGLINTAIAAREMYNDPSAKNILKFAGNATITAVVFFGKMNPIVGVGLAILDLSGVSNKIYAGLGKLF